MVNTYIPKIKDRKTVKNTPKKLTAAQLENLAALNDTELAFVRKCVKNPRFRSEILAIIDRGDQEKLRAYINRGSK